MATSPKRPQSTSKAPAAAEAASSAMAIDTDAPAPVPDPAAPTTAPVKKNKQPAKPKGKSADGAGGKKAGGTAPRSPRKGVSALVPTLDGPLQLPQARVKRIIRVDPDVGNVASDALRAVARSTVRGPERWGPPRLILAF